MTKFTFLGELTL